MEEHTGTYMRGFTHMQKARPTTLSHHMGAYFEMFKRDRSRLADIYRRMNYCPLGSGALAGTTYPLDRTLTAELLEFDGPTLNSMDSVSDRDYLIELLGALSTIMMHLSRFLRKSLRGILMNIVLLKLMMHFPPEAVLCHKKNPDIAELVRGKTGRGIWITYFHVDYNERHTTCL